MQKIYQCDVCKKQYNTEKMATICENKHKVIKEQMINVIKEIDDLYKIGGSIQLSVGSHYSELVELSMFENKNGIAMLANSCHGFVKPKVKIFDKKIIQNDYIIKTDDLIFKLSEDGKDNYFD